MINQFHLMSVDIPLHHLSRHHQFRPQRVALNQIIVVQEVAVNLMEEIIIITIITNPPLLPHRNTKEDLEVARQDITAVTVDIHMVPRETNQEISLAIVLRIVTINIIVIKVRVMSMTRTKVRQN